MAAAVWSGYLAFGLISIPVRLLACARNSGISFHLLHRKDNSRLKQQYVCKAENVVVDGTEIVKGYEYRKGEYVVVDPKDIKKIEPKTAETMDILQFVKTSEIDPLYFDISYFMIPEEAGRRAYALLTKVLEQNDYYAIAKLTMHNREYTVILRPHRGGLMLHTMYYKNEVTEVEGLSALDIKLKEAEIKGAHQLVEALAAKWEPEKFHDSFQANLKRLIQTKLNGEKIVEVEKPKKLAPVIDITSALRKSLAQVQASKRPAAAVREMAAVKRSRRRA